MMRIRCAKNVLDQVNYDLEIGAQYEVIAIEAGDYRVFDDKGRPYLFPAVLFDVVDANRPAHWKVEVLDGVEYASAPELSSPGFFEDYFEHNQEAVRAFSRYVNKHLRLNDAA